MSIPPLGPDLSPVPTNGSPEVADALDWGGRAKASYRLAIDEPVYEARYHNFCEGENFWQAAMAHAERSEDAGILMRLAEDIESLRDQALRAVQSGLGRGGLGL